MRPGKHRKQARKSFQKPETAFKSMQDHGRPVRKAGKPGDLQRPGTVRRTSENDDRLGAQLHAEAFLHAVLDAAGQVEDVLAGGLTVIDQHQGMAG